MQHEPPMYHAPEEQKRYRSNACSLADEQGIHAFRVLSNISVILFHTLLLWGVLEGAPLQETLKVQWPAFLPLLNISASEIQKYHVDR